jgi:hypothetical protein
MNGLGAVAVPCPHCGVAAGEYCRSDKGRVWKASTHYVRRARLKPLIKKRTAAKRKLKNAIVDAAVRFCASAAQDVGGAWPEFRELDAAVKVWRECVKERARFISSFIAYGYVYARFGIGKKWVVAIIGKEHGA